MRRVAIVSQLAPALAEGAAMLVHLVARTRLGVRVLAEPEEAFRLWALLKNASQCSRSSRSRHWIVAACIMPDHVHVIAVTRDAAATRRGFAARLAAYARQRSLGRLWRPLPHAEPIQDRDHLLRQVRYVHLNPCRAGLVSDPLLWPWSTHRGVLGAELEPIIDGPSLCNALGRSERAFPDWFHAYVSGDPTTAVAGTPPPKVAVPGRVGTMPLGTILDAAGAATPYPWQRNLRRHLFVLLAREHGWRDNALVASALEISPRHVCRLAARSAPELLSVGRRFLGDARLRFVPGPGQRRRNPPRVPSLVSDISDVKVRRAQP